MEHSTDTKFVVDIAISLTMKEMTDFIFLSKQRGEKVAETVRYCMNSKCQELINGLDTQRVGQETNSSETGEDNVLPETPPSDPA